MSDQFEGREHKFNDSVGKYMGKFTLAMVESDIVAKAAGLNRALEVIGMENIEVPTKVSLVGLGESLETRVSMPPITMLNVNGIQTKEAKMVMDMTVSASEESSSSLKSDTEVSGSAKVRFGLFSVGMSMKAAVSVASDKKRKSDYSATTHAELTMEQAPLPEGLAIIIEAANETVRTGMEINKVLAGKQADRLLALAQASDAQTAPAA